MFAITLAKESPMSPGIRARTASITLLRAEAADRIQARRYPSRPSPSDVVAMNSGLTMGANTVARLSAILGRSRSRHVVDSIDKAARSRLLLSKFHYTLLAGEPSRSLFEERLWLEYATPQAPWDAPI